MKMSFFVKFMIQRLKIQRISSLGKNINEHYSKKKMFTSHEILLLAHFR